MGQIFLMPDYLVPIFNSIYNFELACLFLFSLEATYKGCFHDCEKLQQLLRFGIDFSLIETLTTSKGHSYKGFELWKVQLESNHRSLKLTGNKLVKFIELMPKLWLLMCNNKIEQMSTA